MIGPTLIWGETEYVELWGNGFPQETFNNAGQMQEATRVYYVDYDARAQARIDFLGWAEAIPSVDELAGVCHYLSRSLPHFHADFTRPFDGQTFLFADQVTFEPVGIPVDEEGNPQYGNASTITALGTPMYRAAKMTVHYSARNYRVLADTEIPAGVEPYGLPAEDCLKRYCEILSHPGLDTLVIPGGTFKYGPAPVDVNNVATTVTANAPALGQPGKIQGVDDITIIWRQVPRLMVAKASVVYPDFSAATQPAAFDYALGRVNNATFFGFPAETLLCEPMEIQPWIQADGDMVFDVIFHFKYKRTGWNYPLALTTGNKIAFSQITANDTNYVPGAQTDGQTQYDAYTFNYLFYGYLFSAGSNP